MTTKKDEFPSGTSKEQGLPGGHSRRALLKLGGMGVAGLTGSAALGAELDVLQGIGGVGAGTPYAGVLT